MADLPFLWASRQNAVPPEELGLGAAPGSSAAAGAAGPAPLPPSRPPPSTSTSASAAARDPLAAAAAAAAKPAPKPAPEPAAEPAVKPAAAAAAAATAASTTTTRAAAAAAAAAAATTSSWREELVVASRLHFGEAAQENIDVNVLGSFLRCALAIADTVVLAVGASSPTVAKIRSLIEAVQGSQQHAGKRVHVLEVKPWGKFVPALNALTSFAANQGFKYICFQSLEVNVSPDIVRALVAQLQLGDTLVAGAAFPEDHLFASGWHVLNGRTSPWNTLAVWSVSKLALTGFSLIAEGLPHEGVAAGVEEVSTISILQRLMPRQAKAKLLLHREILRSQAWNTDFQGDEARREWHRKKMLSKVSRPAAQLDALGIDPGIVQHISLEP